MKRLFIKELTENRLVPVWCALLLGLLMVALSFTHIISTYATPQLLFGSWITAAVFAAAGLVSREVGSESLQFLMSLPVSRRTVWMIKCAAGLAILLAAIGLTSVAWIGVQTALVGSISVSIDEPFYVTRVPWLFGCALTCFSVSLALSSILDRAISTAMMAVVTCTALMIPIGLFGAAYGIRPLDDWGTISVIIILWFPAFLAASYWSFTRGESLRTSRRFWFGAAGLVVGAALAWSPAVAFYGWWSAFDRFSSVVEEPALTAQGGVPVTASGMALSPDGKMLLLEARHHSPFQEAHFGGYAGFGECGPDHFVLQPIEGRGPRRVFPAGTLDSWSPDSRFLLYRKKTSRLGLYLRSDVPYLCNVQTGSEQRLAWGKPLNSIQSSSWSPDGRWLAVFANNAETNYDDAVLFYEPSRPVSPSGDLQAVSYLPLDRENGGYAPVSVDGTSWSADGHIFYLIADRTLSAVDPTRISKNRSQDFTKNGAVEVEPYALCKLDADLKLEMTWNFHRSLARVSMPGGKTASDFLVDLAAATEAVEQRRSVPIPSLTAWLSRWHTRSFGSRPAMETTQLTPDGRYFLATGLESEGRRPRTSTDLDQTGSKQQTLLTEYTPAAGWWLADGHRFCARGYHGEWNLYDAATGSERLIDETVSNPLGVTRDGRFVLARFFIKDVFDVVEKIVPL